MLQPLCHLLELEGVTEVKLLLLIKLLFEGEPKQRIHELLTTPCYYNTIRLVPLEQAVSKNYVDIIKYFKELDTQLRIEFHTSIFDAFLPPPRNGYLYAEPNRALHVCVTRSNYYLLNLLISYGMKTDIMSFDGDDTVVRFALKREELRAAELLVNFDVVTNYNDLDLMLFKAAIAGSLRLVRQCLAAGANINNISHGRTPLMGAVTDMAPEGQCFEVVKLLVCEGADVDIVSLDYSETALLLAIANKKDLIAQFLLSIGASLQTPVATGRILGDSMLSARKIARETSVLSFDTDSIRSNILGATYPKPCRSTYNRYLPNEFEPHANIKGIITSYLHQHFWVSSVPISKQLPHFCTELGSIVTNICNTYNKTYEYNFRKRGGITRSKRLLENLQTATTGREKLLIIYKFCFITKDNGKVLKADIISGITTTLANRDPEKCLRVMLGYDPVPTGKTALMEYFNKAGHEHLLFEHEMQEIPASQEPVEWLPSIMR